MTDHRQVPDQETPRDVMVSGVRIVALLFVLGMGLLLYYVWTQNTPWAIFWWLFVAFAVPGAAAFFYSEARFFYLGARDQYPNGYHRLAAWIGVLALVAIFVLLLLS